MATVVVDRGPIPGGLALPGRRDGGELRRTQVDGRSPLATVLASWVRRSRPFVPFARATLPVLIAAIGIDVGSLVVHVVLGDLVPK